MIIIYRWYYIIKIGLLNIYTIYKKIEGVELSVNLMIINIWLLNFLNINKDYNYKLISETIIDNIKLYMNYTIP